jgi:hypothetical protein
MSLLRDIQATAIDSSTSLETLLRMCRVLASRLKNEDLKLWVQHELDCYVDAAELPNYRQMTGACFGHFSGAFGAAMRSAPIPPSCIPNDFREKLTRVELREGVAGLEQILARSKGSTLHVQWPADAAVIFGEQIYQGYNLMQGWIAIPTSFVANILSTVRTRVLNFALEIEAQNPDAGEATSGSFPIPRESVSQIFNNYIYGNVANVASGQSITQSATMAVHQGDFASLAKALKENGLENDDIDELQGAVKDDPRPEGQSLGPKASSWMGKMVTKAAQGTWKIGAGVAANLLTGLIKAYYGI